MSQKCTYHIWYTWHFVQCSSVPVSQNHIISESLALPISTFLLNWKNKPQEKAASLQIHQLIRTTGNENAPKEMNTKVNHIKKKQRCVSAGEKEELW